MDENLSLIGPLEGDFIGAQRLSYTLFRGFRHVLSMSIVTGNCARLHHTQSSLGLDRNDERSVRAARTDLTALARFYVDSCCALMANAREAHFFIF